MTDVNLALVIAGIVGLLALVLRTVVTRGPRLTDDEVRDAPDRNERYEQTGGIE